MSDNLNVGGVSLAALHARSTLITRDKDPGVRRHQTRTAVFKLLLDCFALQIRFGCEDDGCTTPSCYSYRKSLTHQPVRRPTVLTARDEAFVLASEVDPLRHLCIHPLRTSVDGVGRVNTQQVRAYVDQLWTGGLHPVAKRYGMSEVSNHHEDGKEVDPMDGKASASVHSHSMLAEPQAKTDKGSLAQNLFNSETMRALFAQQASDSTENTDLALLVHKDISLANALQTLFSIQQLHEHSQPLSHSYSQLFDYASRCCRFVLSSISLLLHQLPIKAPPIPLRALPTLALDTILDSSGKTIDCIQPLGRYFHSLYSYRSSARNMVFDSLKRAIGPIFHRPLGIRATTGNADDNVDDKYINDESAARIIFFAICALLGSIPPSNDSTLTTILDHRSAGSLIPSPLFDPEDNTDAAIRLQAKRLGISEAFEDESALRLADQIVLALATRRAQWLAMSASREQHGDGEDAGPARVFPLMQLIVAHMILHFTSLMPPKSDPPSREFVYQKLQRYGQTPGPILVEWLKTVFRASWNGESKLRRWNSAGAALELLNDVSIIYRPRAKTTELGLIPQHFQLPALAGRLHAHKLIPEYMEWMKAQPGGSRRHKNERHLLQFPFIFDHGDRTFYFRLMMYNQMHLEWQFARGQREIQHQFEWGLVPGSSDYQCPNPSCTHAMCERQRFIERQSQRWAEAQYRPAQRFPNNFWNRELYLRHKLAKEQAKFLVIDIERQTILESAFNQLWGRTKGELMKPLKVVMRMDGKDEDAADHGGVSQEFFRLVLGQAFMPTFGLFVQTDEQSWMNWFQPMSSEPLQTFELIGLLFGMAVYNGITLPVNFPYAFYHILCHGTSENISIADGWPSLARSFQQLASWDEQKQGSIEDVFARDFAFTFNANGTTYTIDMQKEHPHEIHWPTKAGETPPAHWTDDSRSFAPVTGANRFAFMHAYSQWLVIHSVKPQLDAFIKGFRQMVPAPCTTFLQAAHLQSFVEGNRNIDVNQLRSATSYATSSPSTDASPPTFTDEYSAAHPTVQFFWNVVSKYDQSQLRRLLLFVTASDRVPAQGYKAIGFSVEKHGGVESLPTSSTCFGKLFLPPYESEERLQKSLTTALEHGMVGFGFM